MTAAEFRQLALSFPATEETPHFERIAFKIIGKRIYATLHEATAIANLKLPLSEQQAFCSFGKKAIYPVPNKWGLQGWTTFELKKLQADVMQEALRAAHEDVFKSAAKKKVGKKRSK